jgi:hypothetical protein
VSSIRAVVGFRQHPIDADFEAKLSKVLKQKHLAKIADVANVLFFHTRTCS